MTIQETFASYGFKYPDGLIMAFIGGSTQHGAKAEELACHDRRHSDPCFHTEGKECQACTEEGCDPSLTRYTEMPSDTDYLGIYIPPRELTIGIDRDDSFSYPDKEMLNKRKRGERDITQPDIALHSLQKWAGMAATGNPTVLSFLFATAEMYHGSTAARFLWELITDSKHLFLSKHHGFPFIKYAEDQMQRLLGLRGQKNVNRDHLTDKYGYDTKYAMHIVRLLSEAKELMETGRITYPRPEVDLLKDIRRGKYSLAALGTMVSDLQIDAYAAIDKSHLSDNVDRDAISKLIAEVHLEHYGR